MPTLLIVDDSNYNRKLVKKMLSEYHYDVVEAADGQIALDLLGQHPIDCIILDLMMPVMDGFHLLQTLHDAGNTIPIVVVTADIQHETEQHCLNMGAAVVLHKPVATDDLKAAVTHILREAG